jgi:ribosome biogenesis protein YTM1
MNAAQETVTTVEYIPAVGPPAPQGQGQHKDWISAVDGAHGEWIVTGCYDGVVRVWTAAGACKAELRGTHVYVQPGFTRALL